MIVHKMQMTIHSQTQYPMYKKKILFLLLPTWVMLIHQLHGQTPCPLNVQIAAPAQITCQNPSVQLSATVTPPGGNYIIDWSGPVSNPGILNPVVTTPGTYALFVYDSLLQCWGGDTVTVTQDGTLPQIFITPGTANCDGVVTLTAVVGPSGSYTYQWSNNQNTASIDVQSSGVYCVTVTNLSGCSAASCFTVNNPAPLSVDLVYYNSFICGDSSLIYAVPSGGIPPYAYLWSNGDNSGLIFDPSPGVYSVTVTNNFGCTAESTLVVEDDPDECAHLQGNVLADWNTNCTAEASDEGLSGIAIKIEDGTGSISYAYTLSDGSYSTEVYPGSYTLTVIPPNSLWDPCQNNVNITVNPNQTLTQDFLLKPLANCPAMTVDLGNPWLRRCVTGHYWVSYCNQGTTDATDAFIEILFDPFLTPTAASIPYTNLGNNVYRFDLGTVPPNTCGGFWVSVFVSCNAQLGQTHCTEAVIHPIGTCEPANPQWSGASLQVTAQCQGDSLDFEVKNTGTGTMTGPLDYVIIEDAVMLMQAPPPSIILGPQEPYHVKVPANGATWRLEVNQEPFHPGNSQPSISVEGCSGNSQFSMGYVNQFPQDDNDPWVDIDCTQNTGSYDPNDKQGFPLGYNAAHYIRPGTDIEYMIRFQNTGTDTAFNVVIRDELSPWLDPGSVKPGASSHPYQFEYYGDRNIKFSFDNIQLPDSSTNFDASQGFVSFRISQKAGVPLETNIENQAGIFFDFNAPVYTNTTVHRVGEGFVTVSAWQPLAQGISLRVMPNPVAETAVLQLEGIPANTSWQVLLLDASGRPVRTENVTDTQWQFDRSDLPAGIYFLRVISDRQVLGTGKVTLR